MGQSSSSRRSREVRVREGAHRGGVKALAPLNTQRLATLLVDGGGRPVRAERVEGALSPNTGSPPLPRRLGPTAPETALRRAVFWRHLLQQRIDETRARAAEAQLEGREALAERHERVIARLERERPTLDERIAELESRVQPTVDAVEEAPVGAGELEPPPEGEFSPGEAYELEPEEEAPSEEAFEPEPEVTPEEW